METMLTRSGSSVNVYIVTCPEASTIVATVAMDCGPSESRGFSRRCAEGQLRQLESIRWKREIHGSGQTFESASQFRSVVYLMSIAGRFKVGFKRNCRRHMSLYCKADGCPWKITCRSIGQSSVVRVHTFHNVHCHSIEDISMMQPEVKPRHAADVVDEIFRSTPEYQPRQLCKDFLRQHGMHLSYKQAWRLKEKASHRLYGHPNHFYKLLPWICSKIEEANPKTVINLSYSSDERFEHVFIAHGVSIEGFKRGCRPLIALDSCHMSGPFSGSLFAANAFDANDSLFTVAFAIVSAENYVEWQWFLNNLRGVVGDGDIVIISDRHPALVRAVPEIFGDENHCYCYRHVKENFSSYVTKHCRRGHQFKLDALAFLDSVAYGRLAADYESSMVQLRSFNEDFASWVERNTPERWAMSKFPKNRWDKITTNLAESFNAWLKFERHTSICTFLVQHFLKMANMLSRRKESVQKWDGMIGPRIKAKLNYNIGKGESYLVVRCLNGNFGVQVGETIVNVNMMNRTCTCKGWEMSGIPCEHACAVVVHTKQNPVEFVDEWFKADKQQLIYGGHFSCIETHDMPTIGKDGVVRDACGKVWLSLLPPVVKKRPGRPRKNRIESQFMEKRAVYCSRCSQPGHNRRKCPNPLTILH